MQRQRVAANHVVRQFEEAVALHRAGNLAQAKAMYLQMLPTHSGNADLLRLLGTAEFQLGQPENAAKLLEKSLRIDRKQPDALNNLGNALRDLGRFDESLARFDQAIALLPDYVEAYSNRGNVLRALSRFDEALANYDTAISANPNVAEFHNNRGNTLRDLNRMDAALESFDRAIALKPDYAEAYSNRGNVLRDLGRIDEAMQHYERAIATKTEQVLGNDHASAELYNNHGNGLRDLERFEEAIESYDKAIAANPNYAEAYTNRGTALRDLGRFDEALESHDKAIAIQPNFAHAYNNRGTVLRDLGRYEEALESYARALALDPDYADVYANRGIVLGDLKRFEEALTDYDRAIALAPKNAESHSNKSNVLSELKQLDAAVASLDNALALAPEFADGHWNKSVVKLLNGEFEEGWRLYEWRWKTKQFVDKHKQTDRPLWLGDAEITGKILLVYPEQGLGDFIQFVRYTRILEEMGATLLLEVPLPLVNVVASMEGNFSILPAGSSVLPNFDYHCPIMSLPLACKTTLETIPSAVPYLFADAEKQAAWQAALGNKTKPRVGMVWSGAAKHRNDHNRSISLATLQPLFDASCEFHSLQKEYRAGDASLLPRIANLHCHDNALQDFEDTAALIAEMDVVISVDTSVAHLAGAMGKPVWLLLPFAPDYRWMLHRADSPWYPTMSLLRQPKPGDWAPVMADIATRLAAIT